MNPSYQRATILHQQGRHADAERELRQSLATDPRDPQAHALLGLCLVELKDFQQATHEAQTAIGLAPWMGFTHYVMAQVFFRRNRSDEAIAAINEAIRLEPDNPSYFSLLAALCFERRQWPAALEAAERGLQHDPNHVGCTNLRAMALVKLGRGAEAGATIDAALARDPENAVTHANQGWNLLHQGEHRQALEHFREALRLNPRLEWAQLGIVEALKSRHFVYRWLLIYFLWMSRLSRRTQWGIVIGGYLGYNFLRSMADQNPRIARFIWPLLIAYIVFVALSWLGDPLFNLLLRLNRFGKLALSREQIITSNWIGSMLLAALAAVGAYAVTGNVALLLLAMVFGAQLFPLSSVYRCPKGWPRRAIIGVAAGLGLLGLGIVALMLTLPILAFPRAETLQPVMNGAIYVFVIGVLGAQVLSNYLPTVRVKR
jgi:tetratricopeptide (TPR) repeat protein